MKICITGGAGLVGQNLVQLLLESGYTNLTVIDKNTHNLDVLRSLQPNVNSITADLSEPGEWQQIVANCNVLVSLQAQIGGLDESAFKRNNVNASEHICAALQENPSCYVVHVSSSVLDSKADDFYTRSKRRQEEMFEQLRNPHCTLRPTLMFGWFDRKHLGWLSRFLKASPVFPIPGHGNYLRQPLYVRDFCRIIAACIAQKKRGGPYNISGKERISYIDIIREIKAATGYASWIVSIPFTLFYGLLKVYAWFDRDPPFTITQLRALVIDELFPDHDWQSEFSVAATPFSDAVLETFNDPRFSHVVLEF